MLSIVPRTFANGRSWKRNDQALGGTNIFAACPCGFLRPLPHQRPLSASEQRPEPVVFFDFYYLALVFTSLHNLIMAPKGLPEKDELLRAMKGQSVTKNWDVIVSYSTLQLNKALAVLWKKSKTFTGIKLERNFALLRAKVRYTLTLGSPSMEFLTTGAATAVLNMPIVGWVETFMGDSTTPAMKVEIPPGAYEIQVTVPLVSVSGDVQTESIYKAAKVGRQ